MCGIFGFLLNKNLTQDNINTGVSSLKKLAHRGPDHLNYWFNKEEGIFLGHTRLSIIDLSDASNQPFVENRRATVFNGEIYNFLELRKRLEKVGYSFKTKGDTEVLHKLLDYQFEKYLEEIDGMFAFASYRSHTLTLANDIFGEKPLYYIENNDGFYFSSEIRPLISFLNIGFSDDFSLKKNFLSLGYLPNYETFYKGIKYLAPGSLVTKIYGRKAQYSTYWSKPNTFFAKGKIEKFSKNEIENVEEILTESIKNRLRSDVPVGLFLSSGIDSSLIAAIAKRNLNSDILTMTVAYNNELIHNESATAKKIASSLDLDHIVIDSEINKEQYTLSNLFNLYGEPNDNLTIFSGEQIAYEGRKFFKVALCGSGGDEIFKGYGKHKFLYTYDKFFVNKYLKNGLNGLNKFLGKKITRISNASNLFNTLKWQSILALKNMPYCFDKNLSDDFISDLSFISWKENQSCLSNFIDFDLNLNLPLSIIPALERSSMNHALELRAPFLNKRLLEFVSDLDNRKFLKFDSKSILISILEKYIPSNLISKKKLGFSFPNKYFLDTNRSFIERQLDIDLEYLSNKSRYDSRYEKVIIRKAIYNYFREKTT